MGGTYRGLVLDLSRLDLEEIAGALAGQTDDEHHWLINPGTGDNCADTFLARHPDPALP